MPATNSGCVEHRCGARLLIIDAINNLEFEGGELLLEPALRMARDLARLKRQAKGRGIPCLYVNDNFGQWRSDFRRLVAACTKRGGRGARVARLLLPESDDYFVLKPRHSGFFNTPLDLLLQELGAKRLILCGLTTDSCVLFTANDAYLRGFEVWVPSDGCAALAHTRHVDALGQMRRTLHADTRPSQQIDLERLLHPAPAVKA